MPLCERHMELPAHFNNNCFYTANILTIEYTWDSVQIPCDQGIRSGLYQISNYRFDNLRMASLQDAPWLFLSLKPPVLETGNYTVKIFAIIFTMIYCGNFSVVLLVLQLIIRCSMRSTLLDTVIGTPL